jgi:hypothetical protein
MEWHKRAPGTSAASSPTRRLDRAQQQQDARKPNYTRASLVGSSEILLLDCSHLLQDDRYHLLQDDR